MIVDESLSLSPTSLRVWPHKIWGSKRVKARKGQRKNFIQHVLMQCDSALSRSPQCESALQKLWHHVKNTFFFCVETACRLLFDNPKLKPIASTL